MKLKFFFLAVLYSAFLNAQVGIGTTTPNGALDVTSSTNGFLPPRVDLMALNVASPIVNPAGGSLAQGTIVWNTATANTGVAAPPNNIAPGLYIWDGTKWSSLAGNTSSIDWSLIGNAGTVEGVNFLGTTDAVPLEFKVNNLRSANFGLVQNVSFGNSAVASGYGSFARGVDAVASGEQSTAFGEGTLAEGDYSIAMGLNTSALNGYSVALGNSTRATEANSTAIGLGTEASGYASTAMGSETIASGNYSTTIGTNTLASGTSSFAIGNGTIASGNESFAMGGPGTIASGNYSVAMSFGSASGFGSFARGEDAVAIGTYSTAFGESAIASSDYTTAMGSYVTASGSYSTALGRGTRAIGERSTAMGSSTTASGSYSTAIGEGTIASGVSSTSLGYFTTASGERSTAMGSGTVASGLMSTAIGNSTIASGDGSLATGIYTTASGQYSTAMGNNITARSRDEITLGVYNTPYTPVGVNSYEENDRLFGIGNGYIGSNSDAFTILKNGETGIGYDNFETNTSDALLQVNGKALIANLPAGSATDEVVVADATGVLKKVSSVEALNVPSGNTSQRPSTPSFGAIRYNNDIGRFEGYVNDVNGDGTQGDAGWRAF